MITRSKAKVVVAFKRQYSYRTRENRVVSFNSAIFKLAQNPGTFYCNFVNNQVYKLETTLQEENFHWNLNFANSKFAKFKFCLLLHFHYIMIEIQKSKFSSI